MDRHPSKRRILIVDDDERLVETIVRGFSQRDSFEISGFTSGRAAWDALQSDPFDVIVADWEMPDFDGREFIRDIQERFPDMVTFIMTPSDAPSADGVVEKVSAHHYLPKPFTIDELVRVIDSILPPVPPAPPPKPAVLKVVLVGDANVGKTSVIQRYCTGKFDPARSMTIGVDFHLYDLQLENRPLRLVVWDFGGQDRFGFARRAFYRGAQAVGLVFDASNRISFYNLMRWWREAREYLPNVPILMLANKVDLPRQVSDEEIVQIAQAWNLPLFVSSCASGEGVTDYFEALAEYAWKNYRATHPPEKMIAA